MRFRGSGFASPFLTSLGGELHLEISSSRQKHFLTTFMPKSIVRIVATVAFIAAGLISFLAKPPQTSQPGPVVAPSATSSVQASTASIQASTTSPTSTEDSAASNMVDASAWKAYTDVDYHFTFRYPQQLVKRTTGPVAYAIKRISLSDEVQTRIINFYVTTTSSISRWNEHVASEDAHNCARVCDEPYSYLVCETSSTACTEDSFQGSFSVNFERRAVFNKGGVRLEMLVKVPLATNEVPTSTNLYDLNKSGALSAADLRLLGTSNLIFQTLRFIRE